MGKRNNTQFLHHCVTWSKFNTFRPVFSVHLSTIYIIGHGDIRGDHDDRVIWLQEEVSGGDSPGVYVDSGLCVPVSHGISDTQLETSAADSITHHGHMDNLYMVTSYIHFQVFDLFYYKDESVTKSSYNNEIQCWKRFQRR